MADEEDVIRLTIGGKMYTVDPDDLELGEIEIIEDACNASLGQVDFNRASAIRAMVYIVKRREDPRFTMDDARHIKLGALQDVQEPPAEAVKTNGAGKKTRPTGESTTAKSAAAVTAG